MIIKYQDAVQQHKEFLEERSEWEAEWRNVSDFLIPGRGIFQTYAKPRKRKLTSPKVINTIGEDALNVLTSGIHGGLTSPARPWFDLSWSDPNLKEIEPLKKWLQDCTKRLHTAFQSSNFYSIINSFYTEYAGFGTGSIFMGEHSNLEKTPFRFELLTAGEYSLSYGVDDRVDTYYRTILMSPYKLYHRFPKGVSKELKKRVEKNDAGIHKVSVTVLECVYPNEYNSKPYTQVFYELTAESQGYQSNAKEKSPLEVKGFHEHPYPTARWGTIGSDIYGIGPGSRALPDIRRLQEMERAGLMATHKGIDPPLNVPARMRGAVNTLPGGRNYYSNVNEVISQLYQVNFDHGSAAQSMERVEQRIQRNFFNDIFLTAARDPNASPLRTGQVHAQEQEKMLRLGPVIERLHNELLQSIVERGFNIMLRNEMFQPLSPELAELAGSYNISLVSPLAAAQRQMELKGITSFLGFIGQTAQFDQQVLDNVDIDEATREYADITGVPIGVLRSTKDVDQIRKARAERAKAEQQREMAAQDAATQSQLDSERASAAKQQAEAGKTFMETQETAENIGY